MTENMRSCIAWISLSLVFLTCVYGKVCEKTVTLATYNTGLSSRLADYDVRRQVAPRVIADLDADVVCLQELWFEDDLVNVIQASDVAKPYVFSSLHHDVNQLQDNQRSFWSRAVSIFSNTPCFSWRLFPFLSCQLWRCHGKNTMALLQCMEKRCRRFLDAVPQECITCIVVGYSDIKTGLDRCGSMFHGYRRFNTQGLLLLSRKKIISARKHTFIDQSVKQILPRGYIEAEIEDIGTVVCTHLTTNYSSFKFEYNLKYATPQVKHADELRILHDKFKNRNHLIMGDLNTGPLSEGRDLWGDFPDNYAKLKHVYGYTSVYEENNGTCTYCSYNSIQNNMTRNKLLDHILLKSQSYINPKRILTKRRRGRNQSDHFGIQVDVCMKPLSHTHT